MNPFVYGGFALMLISHKLLRWVPYLLTPFAIGALFALAPQSRIAVWMLAAGLVSVALGTLAITRPRIVASRHLAIPGFLVAVLSAGFLAWCDAIRGARLTTWNPTPRPHVSTA
jgi:hypothetical protein